MRRAKVNCRSKQRGFTLIEALISTVLAGGLVVGLLGIVPYGFNATQMNSVQIEAVAVGQQYLDGLREAEQSFRPLPGPTSAPIDAGNGYVSNAALATTALFTVTPNTCPVSVSGSASSQYDCSVTVSWTQNGVPDSIKVETLVTR